MGRHFSACAHARACMHGRAGITPLRTFRPCLKPSLLPKYSTRPSSSSKTVRMNSMDDVASSFDSAISFLGDGPSPNNSTDMLYRLDGRLLHRMSDSKSDRMVNPKSDSKHRNIPSKSASEHSVKIFHANALCRWLRQRPYNVCHIGLRFGTATYYLYKLQHIMCNRYI